MVNKKNDVEFYTLPDSPYTVIGILEKSMGQSTMGNKVLKVANSVVDTFINKGVDIIIDFARHCETVDCNSEDFNISKEFTTFTLTYD